MAASPVCSFSRLFPRIKCGLLASYPSETTIVNLRACNKDITSHLQRLHLPKTDVTSEWTLLIARSGNFDFQNDDFINSLTVCPAHRYQLGLCWSPSKLCSHPLHHGKGKPTQSAVNVEASKIIQRKWNTLLPVGSGICRACWNGHKQMMASETQQTTDTSTPMVSTPSTSIEPSTSSDPSSVPSTSTAASTLSAPSSPRSDPSTSTAPLSISSILSAPSTSTPYFEPSSLLMDVSDESPIKFPNIGVEMSPDVSMTESTDGSMWAPTPAPENRLKVLNDFFEKSGYETVRSQLTTPLEEASERTVRYYKQKAFEGISLVLNYLAPRQEENLMCIVNQSKKTAKVIEEDPEMIETLVKCYQEATTWQTKRQILSIFAHKFTKLELLNLIPGITTYKVDQARKHATETGAAQPVELVPITRCRLDATKVDHFLDFITRPEFLQDVAFGTKKLKLSHGERIEIPNVVRTVISSRIIKLYETYCIEVNIAPLKRTTLYNILQVCGASKKVSLAGLDNIAAEGASGFETISNIVKLFTEMGKSAVWERETQTSLRTTQLYLKTDFKLHVSKENECAHHCLNFALSEKSTCTHEHTISCSNCENLLTILKEIGGVFNETDISYKYDKQKDEMMYDFDYAKKSIIPLKSHIIRAINQDICKVKTLEGLGPNDTLLTMDWAMKFLPSKFREAQQDWFAKKGISWHISALVTKSAVPKTPYNIHCLVQLIDKCIQNWYSVVSIVEATVCKMKELLPQVKNIYTRSDNAGCYHTASTVLALPSVGQRHGVKFISYDFSEAQTGKDICDRKIASLKTHIQRYINEGHDVTNAEQMMKACASYGGVRGCYVTVMTIDDSAMAEPVEWAGITNLTNFSYEKKGVRVWNAYDIGTGTYYSYDDLFKKSSAQPETNFSVEPYSQPENTSGSAQSNESACKFNCTVETCTKSFSTEDGLTRHLSVGNHKNEKVLDTRFDKIARSWQTRVGEMAERQTVSEAAVVSSPLETELAKKTVLNPGWALKPPATRRTFSQKTKDFLMKEFMKGVDTGKKEDPANVAKRMKSLPKEDWLSSRQIASYFSRLSALQKCGKLNIHPDETDEVQLQSVSQVVRRTRLRRKVITQIDE